MKVTYAAAIGDALKEEMRRDGKVLIYGEDIAQFGNIFGITRGMLRGADVFRLHPGCFL